MGSLKKLQADFMRALIDKDTSLLRDKVQGAKLSGEQCLNLYQEGASAALLNALEVVYPVIKRLVGQDCFYQMCRAYIKLHTTSDFDIAKYGQYFDQWLEEQAAFNAYPYLPDIARLEWACHHSLNGPRNHLMALERLGAVDPEQHGKLIFELPKYHSLLHSDFPIDKIWHSNQRDSEEEVVLNIEDCDLLVWLDEFNLRIDKLSTEEFAFFSELEKKVNFQEAYERSGQGIDLEKSLLNWIKAGWIVDFNLE